jgi:hypothetical protein
MVESIRASDLADRAKEMLTEVYRTGRLANGKNGNGKLTEYVPGPVR